MIPLTLSLKNFLSYGDQQQTVDFSSYSLICLSGKNGHGKSALLDAMTWALWGQARKIAGTAKADAGLLRLGATRMMVTFEFIFNGRKYRVRREYSQTYGKPLAGLDFEVFDQSRDEFVSLTDKTIRATQEKIEQLIGLDYETFTNSAFLRQGQSNEFSKKSPRERKQILATILGVSLYDSLQTKAGEKARILNDDKKVQEAFVAQVTTELSKENENEQAYQKAAAELQTTAQKLTQNQQLFATLESKKEKLGLQKGELGRLIAHIEEREKVISTQKSELLKEVATWKKVHAASLHSPSYEKIAEHRKALLQQEADFRLIAQQVFGVQQELMKAKDGYNKRLNILKAEHEKKKYEERLNLEKMALQLRQVQDSYLLKEKQKKDAEMLATIKTKDKEQLEVLLKDRTEFETTYGLTKAQFDKRRTYHQVLISRGQSIDQQLSEITAKRGVLCEQQSPSCPTCEQVLTIKRRTFLLSKFEQQEHGMMNRRKRIAQVVKNLKQLLIEQHKTVETFEQKKTTYFQGAVKVEELSTVSKELTAQIGSLMAELTNLQTQKDKIEANLALLKKSFELKEKEGLPADPELTIWESHVKQLEQSVAKLSYDKAKHDGVNEQIKMVEKDLQTIEELKNLAGQQQQRRETIRSHIQKLKELNKERLILQEQKAQFPDIARIEIELKKEGDELIADRHNLESSKEKLLQQLGSLENEKKRFETLKKEVVAKQERIKGLATEVESYQILSAAFSKDGIQALLIEEAIPEIENEANILLSRLTDNQSQIFIESLRDLKKGGVKETLDIQISDAAGVRPYEMFSGGEAFRIDFALRIAISKLLARRAGTALQTLIIDEGFGSQDDEGLQRLMDALYAISHDFSKIMVVSHLPLMKENFPVHIVVEKGATGSVISVQERG